VEKLRIPRNAFVFVGDGRKALFLRNDGDALSPRLKTEHVFECHNPATREQGTDRPGSTFAGVGARRAGMEPTDWHEIAEQRFARDVAAALERVVRERGTETLVVVAPPRTLAELRQAFHADVKKRIVAELPKDLTHEPVDGIEKHLFE